MQFSDHDSKFLNRYPTYIPMYPTIYQQDKEVTDEKYSTMNKWLSERLKANKDYRWDRVKFSIGHKCGETYYPTGISFSNTDDALAFKLAFGL